MADRVDVVVVPGVSLEHALEVGLNARATVLSILQALSVMAMAMGVLVALTAPSEGPTFSLLGKIPGWPEAWGSMLACLGVCQLIAVRLRWYAAGAVVSGGVALWYLALGASFAVQWWLWAAGPRVTPDPSVYAVAVYSGLAALHVIVADLLRRNRRVRLAQRRER